MRPNSYPASVTNCSVTSVSVCECWQFAACNHSRTAVPTRRAAATCCFTFVSLQSAAKLFPVTCSAAGRCATGCPAIFVLLLSQVECFHNPVDLSHVSVWYDAHRKAQKKWETNLEGDRKRSDSSDLSLAV